jgi:hypothetical protein
MNHPNGRVVKAGCYLIQNMKQVEVTAAVPKPPHDEAPDGRHSPLLQDTLDGLFGGTRWQLALGRGG